MSHILVLHQTKILKKQIRKKEKPVTEKERTQIRIQMEKSRTVIQRKEIMRYESTGKRASINRKLKKCNQITRIFCLKFVLGNTIHISTFMFLGVRNPGTDTVLSLKSPSLVKG